MSESSSSLIPSKEESVSYDENDVMLNTDGIEPEVLADTLEYILRERILESLNKHSSTLRRDVARFRQALRDLPLTYAQSSTQSLLQIRAKQEALQAQLSTTSVTVRESLESLKLQLEQQRAGWRSELGEWQGALEGALKEREASFGLRMAMWRGRLDNMKVKAMCVALTLAAGLVAVIHAGQAKISSNKKTQM